MTDAPHRDLGLDAVITQSWEMTGVRAGSALVRVGDQLMLAQDDDYTLVCLSGLPTAPHGPGPRVRTIPLREGSGAMPKVLKPDFEAADLLPDGRIVVAGSGSAPTRRTVVLLDPSSGRLEMRDASRLFGLVTEALGHDPNLEALLWVDDHVRLFHRGSARQPSAVVDMLLDVDNTATARVRAVERVDLGAVPGANGPVALTFTDADIDELGRQWYVAAAEDTPNAIDDGPVVAAAIGRLEAQGPVWTLVQEQDGTPSVRKLEGLALDPDRQGAWLVTDPDDPDRPAELCRLTLTPRAAR